MTEFTEQQKNILKIGVAVVVVSFIGLVVLNIIGNLIYPEAHNTQLALVPAAGTVAFTVNQKVNLDGVVLTITDANMLDDTSRPDYKFIVFHLSLTNLTQEALQFITDGMFQLKDNNSQQYLEYRGDYPPQASISELNGTMLKPSQPEEGDIVYEVKADASSYVLSTYKESTKQTYQVTLSKAPTSASSTSSTGN